MRRKYLNIDCDGLEMEEKKRTRKEQEVRDDGEIGKGGGARKGVMNWRADCIVIEAGEKIVRYGMNQSRGGLIV